MSGTESSTTDIPDAIYVMTYDVVLRYIGDTSCQVDLQLS